MDKQNLGVGISQRRRPEPDVSVAVSHERGAPRAEGTAVRNHRSGATNARRRGTSKETARKDVEQPREQLQAVKHSRERETVGIGARAVGGTSLSIGVATTLPRGLLRLERRRNLPVQVAMDDLG